MILAMQDEGFIDSKIEYGGTKNAVNLSDAIAA
jgi:hypothetical protein